MKKLLLPLTLLLVTTSLYGGKGKVRIASDHEGAYIYVGRCKSYRLLY
jgi:hypothetical protein